MNSKEAFDKVDIEGFKRVKGNKKFKLRKLSKIEEDGSKTTAYTLDEWKDIKKGREGLPWYKQSGNTIKTARF